MTVRRKSLFSTCLLETLSSLISPEPIRPPDAETFTIHLHFHLKAIVS